jgi:hypothetical protein
METRFFVERTSSLVRGGRSGGDAQPTKKHTPSTGFTDCACRRHPEEMSRRCARRPRCSTHPFSASACSLFVCRLAREECVCRMGGFQQKPGTKRLARDRTNSRPCRRRAKIRPGSGRTSEQALFAAEPSCWKPEKRKTHLGTCREAHDGQVLGPAEIVPRCVEQ